MKIVTALRRRPGQAAQSRIASAARWAIVCATAAYLLIVTNTYLLGGVPLPVWECLVAVPVLVGLSVGTGRAPHLPRPRPGRKVLAVIGLVAAGTVGLFGLSRLLKFHLPRQLGPDLATQASAIVTAIGHARLNHQPAWPFILIPIVALASASLCGTRLRARPGPTGALVVIALVTMIVGDLVLFRSIAMRDLELYLRAGRAFFAGGPVYLSAPLAVAPTDPTQLPFLYPPVTLPVFGLLARLPFGLVATAWIVGSVAAAVASLRLFGISWRWSLMLLLWPGFAEGLYVGNVAVPALLLFAAGLRLGGSLVLAGLFKVQNGIPALGLLRERRWRALASGIGVLVAVIGLSLPFVPPARWAEWLGSLSAFQQSQAAIPDLYGFALPGLVPFVLFLVLALFTIGLGLLARREELLARLGLASVVASPSLYTHGFLVALPAWLRLDAFWFWVAIALTSSVLGGGWWVAIAIGAAGFFVPALARRSESAWDPLVDPDRPGNLTPLVVGSAPAGSGGAEPAPAGTSRESGGMASSAAAGPRAG